MKAPVSEMTALTHKNKKAQTRNKEKWWVREKAAKF